MEWNKAGAKYGIIIATIGGIIALVGLGLFISVFFDIANFENRIANEMSFFGNAQFDPFGSRYQQKSYFPPIGRAAVGVIMFGLGGYIVRIGVGTGLVTNAKPISGWMGGLLKNMFNYGSDNRKCFCPHCSAHINNSGKYCSNCGEKLD
jgi:hypothetical protein